MSGKFMKLKRIIIPTISLIIFVSQLIGCAAVDSSDMVKMIDSGQSIIIEVADPSYEIKLQGEQQESIDWVQLDQLKTYNRGFRQGFDELFNITIVTENGVNGKAGCLYVDENGKRNGNSTLEDAFRNEVFITKYWNDSKVRDKLVELAKDIYVDIGDKYDQALMASMNAYYNLLPDAKNPTAFNPSQPLTREEFYTLLFKAEEGVREIQEDEEFAKKVGGKTEYTKFAQEVDEYGFLSIDNGSLDANNYKGSISRAEAIYMIVNKHFPEFFAVVSEEDESYKDTVNAGDLALKVGFKYKDEETGEIIEKPKWQAYTLAYMLQNPDQGMQEELYKAMVIAKRFEILFGEISRWDEPLSKSEAIAYLVNAYITKNTIYGFKSFVEYGTMTPNELKVDGVTEDGYEYGEDWEEIPPEIIEVDPNQMLDVGITMGEARRMVEELTEIWREEGVSEESIQKRLEIAAKELGTTLDLIMKIDLEDIEDIEEQPEQEPEQEPPSAEQGQQGQESGSEEQGQEPVNNNSGNNNTTGGTGNTNYNGGKVTYDDLPDWMKEMFVTGDNLEIPDLSGLENPFE